MVSAFFDAVETALGPFRTGDKIFYFGKFAVRNCVLKVLMDCPDLTIFGRRGQILS